MPGMLTYLFNTVFRKFKLKRSRADTITNYILFIHVILLLVLIVIMGGVYYGFTENHLSYKYLYEGSVEENVPFASFRAALSYYLLFN
jgi:hypothetical protein